jgi:hypothetical protein
MLAFEYVRYTRQFSKFEQTLNEFKDCIGTGMSVVIDRRRQFFFSVEISCSQSWKSGPI